MMTEHSSSSSLRNCADRRDVITRSDS